VQTKNSSKVRRMACSDAGTTCATIFQGQNDDKIVMDAVTHLSQNHGFQLSSELATHVRGLIKPA
jgi:predicted small metal-binding protein